MDIDVAKAAVSKRAKHLSSSAFRHQTIGSNFKNIQRFGLRNILQDLVLIVNLYPSPQEQFT